MRRTILLLSLVGAMVLACSGVVIAQQGDRTTSNSQRPSVENRYIVVLNDDVSSRDVANEHSQRHNANVTHVYEYAINGYAAEIPSQAVRGIRQDPRVDFVEQDYVQEAFDHDSSQTLPTGIDRFEGDSSSTDSGNHSTEPALAVDIAVLDTGIQPDHEDLNVAGGKNCTSGNADAWRDGHGHGTHVAGTVAATDDTQGVVGAAPGTGDGTPLGKKNLWAMKVLNDNGMGRASWIICGIDEVTKHNKEAGLEDIEVANMSLGGSGSDSSCSGSDSYHKAICRSVNNDSAYGSYPGATYVVAAGNSTKDLKDYRPATYDEVITVTAVADFNGQPGGGAAATCRSDVDDTKAEFSNYATLTADKGHTIAAPGVCIRSTYKGGGYATASGTSMASPHVAGLAALCIAKRDGNNDGDLNDPEDNGPCTGMTPSEVYTKLYNDAKARSEDSTVSPYYGFDEDPKNKPNATRYYGYLTYAGGY